MENIHCDARLAQYFVQTSQSAFLLPVKVFAARRLCLKPFAWLLFLLLGSMVVHQGKAQCPPSYTLSATVPSVNATTGTYTVPAGGPYKIRITAKGAKGGNSACCTGGNVPTAIGGAGGVVNASFPVTPGDQIWVANGTYYPDLKQRITQLYAADNHHEVMETLLEGTTPSGTVLRQPGCVIYTIERQRITKEFSYCMSP